MKALLEFLASNGGMLLAGVSVVLLLGVVFVLVQRQPIGRQRIAEATMVVCVIWLMLACVPLPRFAFHLEKTKPAPTRTLEMYEPKAGDEVIAAEVFKVPRDSADLPQKSTGITVPLPMPPQSSTPIKPQRNWQRIGSVAYVGGVIMCGLYMVLGHVLLHRLLRRSRECPAQPDLRGSVRVRICDDCDRPISFGLLRATILLPGSFETLDQVKQQHILRHELAHISQRDAVGHFLFNVLFPILYFHPLYWILRRKTNLARELIADDVAAAGARESYVADLLALARQRLGHAALATHALGLFGSNTDLYRRMHMLMRSNGGLARRCSNFWRVGYATVLMAALVVLVGTIGVRRAAAQAADADQKAAEVDKRNVQEQTTVAAQREDEVAKLRAQQEQILAQLKALEVEKRQLESELAQRKAEGEKTGDLRAVYKRGLAQQEQTVQQGQAGDIAARLAARRYQELGRNTQTATAEEKGAPDRAVIRDWMNKGNGPKGESNDFAGRAQLDLVSLADRYVDAMGDLQMAQLELNRTAGKENVFTQYERDRAKLGVVKAERKVQIFRAIAQAARESAKADLDVAMQQVQNGIAPKNSVNDAQSRLRILEVILAQ